MNHRIYASKSILESVSVNSVLDVGCRDCEAARVLPENIEYFGNDLFQNNAQSVSFVGDVLEIQFDRTFDCVLALDILEHVDKPVAVFNKLVTLAEKYLIVSLPNIYDIKHKYMFILHDTLGGKYEFSTNGIEDRHRWVMSYREIHNFYKEMANYHHLSLSTKDVSLAESVDSKARQWLYRAVGSVVSKRLSTQTVIALFKK